MPPNLAQAKEWGFNMRKTTTISHIVKRLGKLEGFLRI
jgi:hypothetical protein